jgi:predicted Rossmann-fold nucleotide-binding protein
MENFRHNPVYRKVLKAEWYSYFGNEIPFDNHRVSSASEDSTILLSKRIWNRMVPKLRPYVSKEILERAIKNDSHTGPGAETGPITGAVGLRNFFDMVREAALECGYKSGNDVRIRERCVCVVQRLDAPSTEAPVKLLQKEVEVCLAREDLTIPFSIVPPGIIENCNDYKAEIGSPHRPISDDLEDFLSFRSVRSQMADEIYRYLSGRNYEISHKISKDVVNDLHLYRKATPSSFDTLTIDDDVFQDHRETLVTRAKDRDIMTAALDMTNLVHIPDGLYLSGMSAQNRNLAWFALLSALVSKTLDSDSLNKCVVVMNDGNWNLAPHILVDLVNKGMSKGYEEQCVFGTLPPSLKAEARHRSFCHIDVVESEDLGELRKAADEIMDFRKKGYKRYQSPRDLCTDFQTTGDVPKERRFTVAGFTSASSDNLPAVEDSYAHGKFAAENGYILVTGGSDRFCHSMGAERDGYLAAGGKYDIDVSTPVIVKKETDSGRIPDGILTALCLDIYQRAAYMIALSDLVTVLPGGIGTLQEMLAFFVLQDLVPDMMEGKSLLIHSPPIHQVHKKGHRQPFWKPALEAVLPEGQAEALFRDHDALADRGIYLSTSLEETKQRTKELEQAWARSPFRNSRDGIDLVKASIRNHSNCGKLLQMQVGS